jgi:hypothetical protein
MECLISYTTPNKWRCAFGTKAARFPATVPVGSTCSHWIPIHPNVIGSRGCSVLGTDSCDLDHTVSVPGRADIVPAAASTAEAPCCRLRRWIHWTGLPACGEPMALLGMFHGDGRAIDVLDWIERHSPPIRAGPPGGRAVDASRRR